MRQALVCSIFVVIASSVLLAPRLAIAANKQELESELGSMGSEESTGTDDGQEAPPKVQKPGKKKPAPANLSFGRGKAKKKADDSDLALDDETPSKIAAPAPAEAPLPPAVQAKVTQAEGLAQKNQWSQVADLLKPLQQQLQRDSLFLLANAYSMLKRPADEVRVLDLSSHKYPNDAGVLTRLGLAYSKQGRKDEALEKMYAARDLNSQYKPAYEALLSELQKQENFYESRVLVQDMIKKFGDEPRYISTYCALLTHDAFLQNAVEVCEDATKKDPEDFKNYINLALSLKDKLEPAKAASTLAQAVSRFPRSDLVLVNQAMLFMDAKNFVSANASYQKATQLAPRNTDAWIGLANSDIELHKYKDALAAYLAACKIDQRAVKDFRAVAARLHHEGETDWQAKFTDAVSSCTNQF